jgi:hypothetical protein
MPEKGRGIETPTGYRVVEEKKRVGVLLLLDS